MPLNSVGVFDAARLYGEPARDVLRALGDQAREADRSGYSIFWVAEHHEADRAYSCPLVLLAAFGAATRRIRLGTAGVLLPLHVPMQVAESFSLLERLFPGRIDCGVAGGIPDQNTAAAYGTYCIDRREYDRRFYAAFLFLKRSFQLQTHAPQVLREWFASGFPETWIMGVTGSKRALA